MSDTSEMGDEEEASCKRMRFMEPDVIVVVSDVEFQHYSQILCGNCEYFDTMLASNMKERKEMRIHFPDKDPEEWKVVCQFLESGISCKAPELSELEPHEIMSLVPWFHELGIHQLVEECDVAVATRISDNLVEFDPEELANVALKYGLKRAQQGLIDYTFPLWYKDEFTIYDAAVIRKLLVEYPGMWNDLCKHHVLPCRMSFLDEANRKQHMDSPTFDFLLLATSERNKDEDVVPSIKLTDYQLDTPC